MSLTFLNYSVHLLIVLPIILLAGKRNNTLVLYFLAFVIYYMLYSVCVDLPRNYGALQLPGTRWNWVGKILAIVVSVVFTLVFRKIPRKEYGLTLQQNPAYLKPSLALAAALVVVFTVIMGFVFSSRQPFSLETLLFQLTMPALDEELAYRGIMLALLNRALNDSRLLKGISLANLATALLFAFSHAFIVRLNLAITFEVYYFVLLFAAGLVLGWMTEKTGSLLLAVCTHALFGFLPYLITMLK